VLIVGVYVVWVCSCVLGSDVELGDFENEALDKLPDWDVC